MYSSMRNTTHLVPLQKAKEWLSTVLELRVKAYEARLALPWYSRGVDYLKSGYGEKGYKRTKSFLTAMHSIRTTEELMDLIADEKYHAGAKMRWILCTYALKICGFNSTHINYVKEMLESELLTSNNKYDLIGLHLSAETAIFKMYEKITDSNDYGAAYLRTLNKMLQPEFYRDKEMKVMTMRG